MDSIHKFLNIILPFVALVLVVLLLPPFLLVKLFNRTRRCLYAENVSGKVVLITGASSGIGEHLAYEYARRGACLALVARRENRLREVADKAMQLGSPDVIVIRADVSKVDDCKQFMDTAVNHFGKLDHLVNNAGITQISMFEESAQFSNPATVMNINFWGAVYSTHFAVPHLKKTKGRIIVIASVAGWFPIPKLSFYNASKSALISFYETLRAEFGTDIGITIVTPGLIESEMTRSVMRSKVQMDFVPAESTEGCARSIVNKACRGEGYVTEPSWARVWFLLRACFPELVDWCSHLLLVCMQKKSKKNE
ncbi:11-beta-hydroxysteroid dehydrogenase-like 4A [Tripterygium wilfordii]|uniref:11-beta-hydroxysteroid dehydrogenase-like 4A n=1 Tax=Tripterygium wilfordii TaxID=458696 RepID=UPI0018F7EEB8|nr:11-beta-hydroxysteroid dehydrogenase-like 4A [Tripterygium wilfordii]